jgi:hypothetical protein
MYFSDVQDYYRHLQSEVGTEAAQWAEEMA